MTMFRALIALALIWSDPAFTQDRPFVGGSGVYRVDDTGTIVLDPVLEMQWVPAGRQASSSVVSASTRVSVQLNLQAWSGRTGRIYMLLPKSSGPTVRVSWRTGGTLLPGTLLSGERALVYSGPVAAPVLRDLIEMKLEADGVRLAQPEALSFAFEIEVDQ